MSGQNYELSSNTNTRGNDKKLFMLSSKKNIRQFSFCVRIIEYCRIPYANDIINASSVNSFKNKLVQILVLQEISLLNN